jgi:GNAT superfamily N-acetyltransferase
VGRVGRRWNVGHHGLVTFYDLVPGPPDLDSYLRLRREAGLSVKTEAQGRGALAGSWSWCHVLSESGDVVAMGRVIGDGGWYFHVADMATLPAHQRQGLGRRVLEWLLADIQARAPAEAYVNLVADPPGRPLYLAMGFQTIAPSVAMARKL